MACNLKPGILNFHCHETPSISYCACWATVFLTVGRGKKKYTCLFMYSSAWMGKNSFEFKTGRKWGDLRAITCQSVKLSLFRLTKECGQPPSTLTLMGTDHLLHHRMHWVAQHPWKHRPTYDKIVQWVQWVLPLKNILFAPFGQPLKHIPHLSYSIPKLSKLMIHQFIFKVFVQRTVFTVCALLDTQIDVS